MTAMQILMLSHGHPAFSIGGAEVASYNLFNGLNGHPDVSCHYLARVGPPIQPHRGTPFLSLRQKERETLIFANDYDYLRLSNRDLETLGRDFCRFVDDVNPDVVHFHHFLGFGVEAIHAVRRVRPNVPIVATLHEYLSICNNHGQMVKTRTGQFCRRASPAECGVCFPDIPASTLHKRELFIKTLFDEVDMFVSPSRFLIDRYADWGIAAEQADASGERPRDRRGGTAAAARRRQGTTQPLRLLRPAQPVQGHQGAGRSGGAGAGGGLGDGLGPLRLRRQPRGAARSRSSRSSSGWCRWPGDGCASSAATAVPICRP